MPESSYKQYYLLNYNFSYKSFCGKILSIILNEN